MLFHLLLAISSTYKIISDSFIFYNGPRAVDCAAGKTPREFRGAWIATVTNIDWPKTSHVTTAQNQADLIALLDSLHRAHINAVIFQVRPVSDAFFQSSIEPWSKYLTGTQGHAPNPLWDPLDFIIKECHKRNMELHAWFNPYRANMGSTTAGLDPKNMALAFPNYAYAYGSYIWMDPGSKAVQDRTNAVIMDVVNRYDIDGVHMDDYFYPYPTSQAFPDSHTFQVYKNGGGTLSLADWRRDNVNQLIHRLSNNIHAAKPYVKFGISPFGIWKSGHPTGITGTSAVDALYADSRLWLQKGWVDYLAPQLYWEIDPPAQSFTALTDWWSDTTQNPHHRHIYPGQADYKIESKNWPISEISRQIQATEARKSHFVLGTIHFSAKDIQQNLHGLTTSLKNGVYHKPALSPTLTYLTGVGTPAKPSVTASVASVSWSGSNTTSVRSWAVYKVTEDSSCILQTVLKVATTSTNISSSGMYYISAVNRLGVEAGVTVDAGGTTVG